MNIKSLTLSSTSAKSTLVAPAPVLLDKAPLILLDKGGPSHRPINPFTIVQYGTDQNDVLYGHTNTHDVMHGGNGDDMFMYSGNGDTFFGDGGNDTVDYSAAATAINVDLVRDQYGAPGAGASGAAAGDTYDHIENIIGSERADTILGDNQANVIVGGNGSDYIEGRGGDDILAGEEGEDTILGGDGNDTIWAGHLYQTDTSNDVIYGGAGNDRITGSHGNNYLNGDDGNDTVFGLGGDDVMNGGNGDDVLYGDDIKPMNGAADGNDTIAGGLGNDTIYGGGGNDHILGGSDNDKIFGEQGNDYILGGKGTDTLSGGSGTNTYAFWTPAEGGDHITDFQHSYIGYNNPFTNVNVTLNTSDKIEIDRSGFGLSDSFTINSATFQSGDHFVGKGTGPMFFYDTGDHTLSFDANGVLPGGQTVLATFDNGEVIKPDDFLLV